MQLVVDFLQSNDAAQRFLGNLLFEVGFDLSFDDVRSIFARDVNLPQAGMVMVTKGVVNLFANEQIAGSCIQVH